MRKKRRKEVMERQRERDRRGKQASSRSQKELTYERNICQKKKKDRKREAGRTFFREIAGQLIYYQETT